MSAASEQVTQVDTLGTDVGTSLAREPEDSQVTLVVVLDELSLVDGAHTELLLDSRDKGGSLEAWASQGVEGLLELLHVVELGVELHDGNVLLTSGLLGLDESGGVVDANDEATSDLGVQSTGVTSLVHVEDLLDPSDDLVRGGVGWLVKVDDTVLLEHINWSVGWRVTTWERSKVGSLHVQLLVILPKRHKRLIIEIKYFCRSFSTTLTYGQSTAN